MMNTPSEALRKVLLVCPDVITERMAGPAIRYWEFAKSLAAAGHRVTLAMPNLAPPALQAPAGVEFAQHRDDTVAGLCAEHDILIVQGVIIELYAAVRHTDKILVADLYDPVPLETLEQHGDMPWPEALEYQAEQVGIINLQLKYADYFLCAGERQKDLWLGALLSLGRINPYTYREIAARVVSVPFGLPDTPPRRSGPGLREQLDGFILLWGGGIWEWFDPLIVIRAVYRLRNEQPDLKLVFLGTRHPNPGIPPMPMQQRAEALARELGMFGKQVIFMPGWVPYEELQSYFLDSDVGVSAHFDTLETRYAFRTRILHYLWAGKPVLTSAGDILAQAVHKHEAGFTPAPGDEEEWVEALRNLRQEAVYRACCDGARKLAEYYTWSLVTQPLHNLCASAQQIGDIATPSANRHLRVRDWEAECALLEGRLDELFNSTSWRISAPLRLLKLWWRRLRQG